MVGAGAQKGMSINRHGRINRLGVEKSSIINVSEIKVTMRLPCMMYFYTLMDTRNTHEANAPIEKQGVECERK